MQNPNGVVFMFVVMSRVRKCLVRFVVREDCIIEKVVRNLLEIGIVLASMSRLSRCQQVFLT
jgi:hypothetical protein